MKEDFSNNSNETLEFDTVNNAMPEVLSRAPGLPAERNGFITFYLWAGIIVNGLLAVLYMLRSIGGFFVSGDFFERLTGLSCCMLMAVGYYMLLKWKKFGFFLIVGVGLLQFIRTLLTMQDILRPTIVIIAGIAILSGVLQIRKNGVSCWSLLR